MSYNNSNQWALFKRTFLYIVTCNGLWIFLVDSLKSLRNVFPSCYAVECWSRIMWMIFPVVCPPFAPSVAGMAVIISSVCSVSVCTPHCLGHVRTRPAFCLPHSVYLHLINTFPGFVQWMRYRTWTLCHHSFLAEIGTILYWKFFCSRDCSRVSYWQKGMNDQIFSHILSIFQHFGISGHTVGWIPIGLLLTSNAF